MPTVFDSVVTKENDHTNLLRNIMERSPKAAAAVLSYLINLEVSADDAASFKFSTQHSFFGVNGREIPDIVVKGRNFHCIIEAKVDRTLDLTTAQKCGYSGCFPISGDCHLSFLVPNEWNYSASVEKIRTVSPSTITVHTATWQGLINRLEQDSKSLTDAILDEAITFWKWWFQSEQMTSQERDFLNAWTEEKYGAIRKLQKTLTRARGLFDARNSEIETEFETSDISTYGFYLKHGRLYILWIGIWTKAPTALSFGFHSTRGNWFRPEVLPSAPSNAHDHHLWPLESETWDDPEKLYTSVNAFLQSYYVQ